MTPETVLVSYSSPSIFYCHRLHLKQVEFGTSTWWELEVYNDSHDRGELIANIHRDDLPVITVTDLQGNTITLDTTPQPCHIDPVDTLLIPPSTPTQE